MQKINKLIKFFDGKKTYIVSAVVALITVAKALNYINDEVYQALLGLLGALGLYSLRDGMRKLEK